MHVYAECCIHIHLDVCNNECIDDRWYRALKNLKSKFTYSLIKILHPSTPFLVTSLILFEYIYAKKIYGNCTVGTTYTQFIILKIHNYENIMIIVQLYKI